MDDKMSFTLKLMLLMTIKMARLQPSGWMRNDSWGVAVGFPASSDYKGAGKLTVDAQLRLWGASGGCNCLKNCDFGQGVFSC